MLLLEVLNASGYCSEGLCRIGQVPQAMPRELCTWYGVLLTLIMNQAELIENLDGPLPMSKTLL